MKIANMVLIHANTLSDIKMENRRLLVENERLSQAVSKQKRWTSEREKVFCYLFNFYFTISDEMKSIQKTVEKYGARKDT